MAVGVMVGVLVWVAVGGVPVTVGVGVPPPTYRRRPLTRRLLKEGPPVLALAA